MELDTLSFDMKYRGLTAEKDDISYNSYWGFGGPDDANNPFVEEIKAKVQNTSLVYNPRFEGAQWAVIEHKGKNVKACTSILMPMASFQIMRRSLPLARLQIIQMRQISSHQTLL